MGTCTEPSFTPSNAHAAPELRVTPQTPRCTDAPTETAPKSRIQPVGLGGRGQPGEGRADGHEHRKDGGGSMLPTRAETAAALAGCPSPAPSSAPQVPPSRYRDARKPEAAQDATAGGGTQSRSCRSQEQGAAARRAMGEAVLGHLAPSVPDSADKPAGKGGAPQPGGGGQEGTRVRPTGLAYQGIRRCTPSESLRESPGPES